MWLESQGELQLLLEGEEPQAAGGARSARGGAAALRARGAGTCLGGEGRGPRARGGRALAALGRGIVQGAQGLGVTSLPTGGAGESGAEDQYNAAAGSAGPGWGRGGQGARVGLGPSPLPEPSLEDARGLGLAALFFISFLESSA